jgi:hypothetical protein
MKKLCSLYTEKDNIAHAINVPFEAVCTLQSAKIPTFKYLPTHPQYTYNQLIARVNRHKYLFINVLCGSWFRQSWFR